MESILRTEDNSRSAQPEKIVNTYEILHKLPGRVRVRVKAIHYDKPLAAGFEDLLSRQTGVRCARVNPACGSVIISFRPEAFDPIAWLDRLRLDEVVRIENDAEINTDGKRSLPPLLEGLHRATVIFEELIPAKSQFFLGAASLVATVLELPIAITQPILALSVLPILNRALLILVDERRIGADLLDGASCTLLIREGGFMPASVMVCLIGLGEFIRHLAFERCQGLIEYQLALSQRSAWLVSGNSRVRVPVSKLHQGDQLVVYPGELIAFAGVIVQGEGTIVPSDPQSDFEPELVCAGDRVKPNTLLIDGKLYVQNEPCSLPELPTDPLLEKVKRKTLQRTQLQDSAQRAGYQMVWPVILLSSLLFAATRNHHRAMAIITLDFITGSRLAIPTALLSSMYQAGSRGVLIRNAETLEKLAQVDMIIFARTGTLTALKPSVTEIFACPSYCVEDVARYAAAIEQRYSAVAAYAIYSYTKLHTIPVPERSRSKVFSGLGVSGEVEGHSILAGNTRLMRIGEIDLAPAQEFLDKCTSRGDSRTCVAIDGKLAGVIAHQVALRPEAPRLVAALKRMGTSVAMTTGGSWDVAEETASKVGIEQVHYRALPEDQAGVVKAYQDCGFLVAFVGHDADDLLALEEADVAITFGTGSEVARYRADIVLTSDDLSGLVESIEIARCGMALARQNIVLVSVPNLFGLALSLADQSNILRATFLNNGSVIVGTINGLRPLFEQRPQVSLTTTGPASQC